METIQASNNFSNVPTSILTENLFLNSVLTSLPVFLVGELFEPLSLLENELHRDPKELSSLISSNTLVQSSISQSRPISSSSPRGQKMELSRSGTRCDSRRMWHRNRGKLSSKEERSLRSSCSKLLTVSQVLRQTAQYGFIESTSDWTERCPSIQNPLWSGNIELMKRMISLLASRVTTLVSILSLTKMSCYNSRLLRLQTRLATSFTEPPFQQSPSSTYAQCNRSTPSRILVISARLPLSVSTTNTSGSSQERHRELWLYGIWGSVYSCEVGQLERGRSRKSLCIPRRVKFDGL